MNQSERRTKPTEKSWRGEGEQPTVWLHHVLLISLSLLHRNPSFLHFEFKKRWVWHEILYSCTPEGTFSGL